MSARPDRLSRLARLLAARCAASRPELLPLAERLARHLSPCRHSPDFSSVHWHGHDYTFSKGQAAIVVLLWKAWKHGTPEMKHESLLERSGSDCERLAPIFQGNPAWGEMIVAGGSKGTVRLANPSLTQG